MPPLDPKLLMKHRSFMVAIARQLLDDSHQAEDVAQDAILAALEKDSVGGATRGWFGAVARNLARLRIRRQARRLRRERLVAQPEAYDSSDQLAHVELQRQIADEVLRLAEPYRSTVIARYFEDRTVRQIAAAECVSRDTIKTRLRRALVQLRGRLDGAQRDGARAWIPTLVLIAGHRRFSVASTGVLIMSSKSLVTISTVLAVLMLFLVFDRRGASQGATRARSGQTPAPQTLDRAAENSMDHPVDVSTIDRHRDLFGVVVDRSGNPVAGARIVAIHYLWSRTDVLARSPGVDGVHTTSASDGTFRLALRRRQVVNLWVSAKGFANAEFRSLQAGERTRVVLAPPGALTVSVVNSKREPVVGASVRVLRPGDGAVVNRASMTDATGIARFADLPVGIQVSVGATHPRHGARLGAVKALVGGRAEIVLPIGAVFAGSVVDEAGKPIAGARVGMSWALVPSTRTDADGRFAINGYVGGDVYQQLHVVATGYARARLRVGARSQLRIVLKAEARIVGRVIDAAGTPIDGARVAALSEEDGTRSRLSIGHANTGTDGRFEIAGLDPGLLLKVSVNASGFGRVTFATTPERAGEHVIGDVQLGAPLAVEGVLQDSSGKPLPRYVVTLRGPDASCGLNPARTREVGGSMLHVRNNKEQRHTDDLGRFRFPDLSPGQYEISATRQGGRGGLRKVVLRSTDLFDVRLELEPGRDFRVRVVTDRGAPVPNAYLIANHEAGQSNGTTDDDGYAQLFVKGSVSRVRVRHVFSTPGQPTPSLGPVQPTRDIQSDATSVQIVMTEWILVAGRTLFAGEPIADALVTARWLGGAKTMTTSANGTFRFSAPPGADVTIRVLGRHVPAKFGGFVNDPSYTSQPVRVKAGEGAIELVVERVKEDRDLTVHVLDPDGEPLAGVAVGFWPQRSGRNSPRQKTDDAGVARLKKLPAREISIYVVVAADAGFLEPRHARLVPESQVLTLRCRAQRHVRVRVIHADGEPAPGARITLLIAGETWAWNCDGDGQYVAPVPSSAMTFDVSASWDAPDGTHHTGSLKGHRVGHAPPTVVLGNTDE